jgi:hypothetical protein
MSDRLAVFNQGRIEQVGPPAEVYEHPENEFIAGFVGVSNVIERDGRRYTVRPEKITLLMNGESPEVGAHVEQGLVRDVQYVGPVTRYHVTLDRGGELQVLAQNLDEGSSEVLEAKGRRVSLEWHWMSRHRVSEGGSDEKKGMAVWAALAGLFVVQRGGRGCGGDDGAGERRSKAPARRSTRQGERHDGGRSISWPGRTTSRTARTIRTPTGLPISRRTPGAT